MRTKHKRNASFVKMECEGTVIGATLGNLVHHCRGSKNSLRVVMAILHKALDPVADALRHSDGDDLRHLIKGMVSHRVLQAQGLRLRELKRAPDIDSRTGHKGVVVGACAAILVAFECMAQSGDVAGLSAQLTICLREVHSALSNWRITDAAFAENQTSIRSEARAIERARAAVARAQEKTEASQMPAKEALQLQLLFYRRAAWPRGETVDFEHQYELLEKISSGELVDFAHPMEAVTVRTPGVVPLSAIAASGRSVDLNGSHSLHGSQANRSSEPSDAESASLSGSSWESFASSVDSGMQVTPTSVTHELFHSDTLAQSAHQHSGQLQIDDVT